MGLIGLHKYK